MQNAETFYFIIPTKLNNNKIRIIIPYKYDVIQSFFLKCEKEPTRAALFLDNKMIALTTHFKKWNHGYKIIFALTALPQHKMKNNILSIGLRCEDSQDINDDDIIFGFRCFSHSPLIYDNLPLTHGYIQFCNDSALYIPITEYIEEDYGNLISNSLHQTYSYDLQASIMREDENHFDEYIGIHN
jgi:hypothetical protein